MYRTKISPNDNYIIIFQLTFDSPQIYCDFHCIKVTETIF